MKSGICIQDMIIIERAALISVEKWLAQENSKIYTRDQTAFYSIEKNDTVIKLDVMPTQHMVFGEHLIILGCSEIEIKVRWSCIQEKKMMRTEASNIQRVSWKTWQYKEKHHLRDHHSNTENLYELYFASICLKLSR